MCCLNIVCMKLRSRVKCEAKSHCVLIQAVSFNDTLILFFCNKNNTIVLNISRTCFIELITILTHQIDFLLLH